jgi:hypothetical protein
LNPINQFVYDRYLTRQLNETRKCIVRLYMLDGMGFVAKDMFSDSDPYLVIKLGK